MSEDNMQAVIDAARMGVVATKLETVGAVAHYAVPSDHGTILADVNLEAGLAAPLRKRGTVQVLDAVSFNAVLDANADVENHTIYINRDPENPSIVAVMNGNGASGPGWGDFRVELLFRPTQQWKKWKTIDGQLLNQAQFAEFVEDNISDVISPVAAEMMEIAQYFSATRSTDFKSAIRTKDGRVQLQNIENMEAKVGAGETAVPDIITLGISPVYGVPPIKIEARFRYRIEGGKLKLGIKLQRVEDIMAMVVNDMVYGTAGIDGRPAVKGIEPPDGVVMVEGIAPAPTK